MSKINYFDSLESLSTLSSRAVFLSCSPSKPSVCTELTSIRHRTNMSIGELEKTLFCDFMPPLERNSIAMCAHSLEKILERSCDIMNYRLSENYVIEKKNREAELCIRLSEAIEKAVFSLRYIKKKAELPDFSAFRCMLEEAQSAHTVLQKRFSSNTYPQCAQRTQHLICELRSELSRCFNCIVEVMLNNI